jgi:hypothetical protein
MAKKNELPIKLTFVPRKKNGELKWFKIQRTGKDGRYDFKFGNEFVEELLLKNPELPINFHWCR